MTLFLASLLVGLASGGAESASKPFDAAPYYAGGIILVVLFGAMICLLVFGKGREHS